MLGQDGIRLDGTSSIRTQQLRPRAVEADFHGCRHRCQVVTAFCLTEAPYIHKVCFMPSTQWREIFLPDENTQHAEQVHVFSELQRKRLKKYGPGRALHRHQVAALKADLAVEEGFPIMRGKEFCASGRL